MIEVGIAGCLGRMGTAIVEAVGAEPDMHIACGIDPHPTTKAEDQAFPLYESIEDAVESQRIDVLVDFTRPSVVEHTLEVALSHDIDCVVGTTGVSAERLREIYEASGTDACLFFAPNFTIGAVLMMQFAKMSAKYFPEAEVIEMHHCNKLDAPSGTAVQTTALICEGMGRGIFAGSWQGNRGRRRRGGTWSAYQWGACPFRSLHGIRCGSRGHLRVSWANAHHHAQVMGS